MSKLCLEASANAITDRYRSSKCDRLIKIYVGSANDTRPFLIQQTTLRATSDYFTKALKHEENMGKDDERGKLKFEDDNYEAWNILIFFMLQKELPGCVLKPDVNNQMLLVNCWIIGDKYMIPAFQDIVMIELLVHLHGRGIDLAVAERAVHASAPESVLRRLVIEEVLVAVISRKTISHDELECISGATGFVPCIFRVMTEDHDRHRKNPGGVSYRNRSVDGYWKEYMVGSGVLKHMIWGE